jgi:hypothetical protein
LISIILKPRASVQLGDYYGPLPRAPMPDPGPETADPAPPAA